MGESRKKATDGPDLELFSMAGRLDRLSYFWLTLWYVVAFSALTFMLRLFVQDLEQAGGPFGMLWAVTGAMVVVGLLVGYAFQVVKRLHDLGRPGGHFFLLYIPIYDIYLGLVLLFRKGNDGANVYGPNPLSAESAEEASVSEPAK